MPRPKATEKQLPTIQLLTLLDLLLLFRVSESIEREEAARRLGKKGVYQAVRLVFAALEFFGLLAQTRDFKILTPLAKRYIENPTRENLYAIATFPKQYKQFWAEIGYSSVVQKIELSDDQLKVFENTSILCGFLDISGTKWNVEALTDALSNGFVSRPIEKVDHESTDFPVHSRSDLGVSVTFTPSKHARHDKKNLASVLLNVSKGISIAKFQLSGAEICTTQNLDPDSANLAIQFLEGVWIDATG